MRPFSERTRFMPGDSFQEDMLRYSSEVRGECEYVASELDHPDYRILDSAQRDYYFCWRSELSKGNLLTNDEGYMWLRMCEIVNLDIDADQGFRELKLMLDKGGYKRVRDTVISTFVDWCIVHRLAIPPVWVWGWDIRRDVVLTSVMSPSPDRLPLEFIKREAGLDEIYYENHDELEAVCNAIIQSLDRHLIMCTGRGILETFSRKDAFLHTAYDGIVTFGEDRIFRVGFLRSNGQFATMMKSVIRYAEKILFKKMGYNGPNCPGAFKAEYRKIADAAAEALEKDGPVQFPKSELLYSVSEVSRKEKMLIEVGEEMSDAPSGRVLEDLTAVAMAVRPGFESQLRSLAESIQPYPKQYVPSGSTNLVPDQAGKDVMDYYLFWRDETKNGTFHDTDRGYLWLYICELINSKEDPEKVLRSLAELARAYERNEDRPFIGSAYLDYALANGIRSVDPGIVRNPLSMNLAVDSVFGDNPSLDKTTVAVASGMKEDTGLRGFDPCCLDALILSLREIDKEMPVFMRCRLKSAMYKDRAFKRFRYYGGLPKEISIEFIDYLTSDSFADGIRDLARCCMQTVAALKGGKGKIKVDRAFGQPVGALVKKCATVALNQETKLSRRRIEIDRDKITKAEAELEEVTGMMGVEDREDDVIEAEAPAEPAKPTGWGALKASLTPEEIGYIASVLAGRPSASGGKAFKLEDSINGKAMEYVGDSVIEDGEAVEDYIQELKEMMG